MSAEPVPSRAGHGEAPDGLLRQLEAWAERMNRELFDGTLPPVSVSVSPNRLRLLGCSRRVGDRWGIDLNACHLDRPKAEVLHTLLHELVHVWEAARVGPRTRTRAYHSAQFRRKASALGIPADRGAAVVIAPEGRYALLLARAGVDRACRFPLPSAWRADASRSARSSLAPWTCRCSRIWAARNAEVRARCATCSTPFERAVAARCP